MGHSRPVVFACRTEARNGFADDLRLRPSDDLAGLVDSLMGVLIVQGRVRCRLDAVLRVRGTVVGEHVDRLTERLTGMKPMRIDRG